MVQKMVLHDLSPSTTRTTTPTTASFRFGRDKSRPYKIFILNHTLLNDIY
jgi:hypothetical protein